MICVSEELKGRMESESFPVVWEKRSQTPELLKKSKKRCEKVLTFTWGNDIMYKLTRAGHRKSTALNLENDTEQE